MKLWRSAVCVCVYVSFLPTLCPLFCLRLSSVSVHTLSPCYHFESDSFLFCFWTWTSWRLDSCFCSLRFQLVLQCSALSPVSKAFLRENPWEITVDTNRIRTLGVLSVYSSYICRDMNLWPRKAVCSWVFSFRSMKVNCWHSLLAALTVRVYGWCCVVSVAYVYWSVGALCKLI